MNKCYYRIEWENEPSEKTPINEDNLNKIDIGLDEVDNRVLILDSTKLDKSTANGMVKDISMNLSNGVITVTYLSGATTEYDTMLEKLAINFDYDPDTQRLVITLEDGTVKYADLSALVTQYEFLNSDTIGFQLDSSGKVKAVILNGSVKRAMLAPDVTSELDRMDSILDISETSALQAAASASAAKLSEQNAGNSERNAKNSETSSNYFASASRSYATGDANGNGFYRHGEEKDNAKYYCKIAKCYGERIINSDSEYNAHLAESYAKGGKNDPILTDDGYRLLTSDGVILVFSFYRDNEDTDNAKYYSELADIRASQSAESATLSESSASEANRALEETMVQAGKAERAASEAECYRDTAVESARNASSYANQSKHYAELSCTCSKKASVSAKEARESEFLAGQSKEQAQEAKEQSYYYGNISQSYAIGNANDPFLTRDGYELLSDDGTHLCLSFYRLGEESDNSKYYSQKSSNATSEAETASNMAHDFALESQTYAENAKTSAQAASAAVSLAEKHAATSMSAADEAKGYMESAMGYADNADKYADLSLTYSQNSLLSAEKSFLSESHAKDSELVVENLSTESKEAREMSEWYSKLSQSYALGNANDPLLTGDGYELLADDEAHICLSFYRIGERKDSAKWYAQQAKDTIEAVMGMIVSLTNRVEALEAKS